MTQLLRPILELSVVVPGMLLGYLPMVHHLRLRPEKLTAILLPLLLTLCTLGGCVCYFLNIRTGWVLLALVMLLTWLYTRTLDVSRWKSVNVVLAICAVFACLNSVTRALNALLAEDNSEIWFCLSAGLIYNALCFAFVAIAWYPATHAVVELLDDEGIAQTWYVFWILPLVFVGLNLFMVPVNPGILFQGRIMQGYIVISLMLLAILGLFYALFYMMARSLTKNDQLRMENQFLTMQQAQYNSLLTAIEETREARHDMRHHIRTLSTLLQQKQWAEAEKYLVQAQESIPSTELALCPNPAVNGVAGHYGALFSKYGIPYQMKLELPAQLPIGETELCVVLSNLLENALEASLRTEKDRRRVRVHAYLHSQYVTVVKVENTYDGAVVEKDGVFQSSKRKGNGIGLQSVRRIAEKKNGTCQFLYDNGVFQANVLLRSGKAEKP